MRLNRYLAMCGVAARRKAEEILLSGRVRVNGKIVLLPSVQVEPGVTSVMLDGVEISPEENIYLVMNKPIGYVCAVSDEYSPVVMEILPKEFQTSRIFPVGRLDRDSEGLLILTNDGAFAHKIMHPSFEITKEYEIELDRAITEKAISRWKEGYEIEGQFVKPIELEKRGENLVRVVIGEGLKREVREMARLAGFATTSLIRRKIGKMELKNLKPGECVQLTLDELTKKIHGGDTK